MLAGHFIDEPLRAYMEHELNNRVQGYSFRIEKLNFHPIGFSLDLKDVTVRQNSAPDPPVATIPRWNASLEWTALLFGRLVNNHFIERPILHITLTQVKQEASDEIPVEERGWQDAIQAVYPFKIDEIQIVDGALTYLDEASPSSPLRFRNLNLKAANIRNVRSRDREYPSEFHFEGDLLDTGRLRVDGNADFLAEPHPGIKGEFHLGGTPLGGLVPVTGRYNVQLRQGTVSADGQVEYAPKRKVVHLTKLTLEDVRADYVHATATKASEEKRARQAYQAAKQLHNDSELLIRVDQAKLVNCELGFVNQATEPDYRVYLAQTDLELENFSNQFSEGTAVLTLKGKFMGTGDTLVTGTFRPERESPDFDLNVKIRHTQMKAMNDLWRAYGNFDVVRGLFSFYSELTIKSGAIQGYLKPLFNDMKIYDERQDRDKGIAHRLFEGLAGDLASLLENPQRGEVATKADVSGPVENPKMNTLDVVLRLIQNALFQTILPGFEREVRKPR
jgi:hypothetical protein